MDAQALAVKEIKYSDLHDWAAHNGVGIRDAERKEYGPSVPLRFVEVQEVGTKTRLIVFDRVPASYRVHGAARFSGVKQIINFHAFSNALPTSYSPRLPLSMSVSDIQGLAACSFIVDFILSGSAGTFSRKKILPGADHRIRRRSRRISARSNGLPD